MLQDSDPKDKLKNLGITFNYSTTPSTDAEEFYPLERLKLARKAVNHFSKKMQVEDQINIGHRLDQINVGRQSLPLAFMDKCYEHNGNRSPEEKGLTFGGCKSVWPADLPFTSKHVSKPSIQTLICKRLSKLTTIKRSHSKMVQLRNNLLVAVISIDSKPLSCNCRLERRAIVCGYHATMSAGVQHQHTKSNTTEKKKVQIGNAAVGLKKNTFCQFGENLTCVSNISQLNSLIPSPLQTPNVKASHVTSSDKAIIFSAVKPFATNSFALNAKERASALKQPRSYQQH